MQEANKHRCNLPKLEVIRFCKTDGTACHRERAVRCNSSVVRVVCTEQFEFEHHDRPTLPVNVHALFKDEAVANYSSVSKNSLAYIQCLLGKLHTAAVVSIAPAPAAPGSPHCRGCSTFDVNVVDRGQPRAVRWGVI